MTETPDPLAVARATNQRLNYEKQRLEKELATYRRAVAQWEISDAHAYVPLRSVAAIAKAAGLDVPAQWEPHYQRAERAEAERDSLGREADRLRKDWVEMRTRAERAEADRAAVLYDEAALIELHCPDHSPQDQDGVWMDCHCAVAEDMRKRASELRRVADETPRAEAAPAPDVVAAIVAALQKRAGELSELAEEQMRPSLEERAQEWHEAADVARRTAKAATAAPAPFTPPAHYRRDDGVDCCVHTIPVGPDSCPHCRELHDEEQPAVGAQQPKEAHAPETVAYQSKGGRLLRCLTHAPEWAAILCGDFHPVTSEDLPDGGLCTAPVSLDERCGVDVLIPQQPKEA